MYGLYLIPPPSIVIPVSVGHGVLEREFRLKIAGGFMVHVTVKGFFVPKEGVIIDELINELDKVMAENSAFDVSLGPMRRLTSEKGDSVAIEIREAEALVALQQSCWSVIKPYVAEDCKFTLSERPSTGYWPHLSLIQYDLPADRILQQQALEVCHHIWEQLPRTAWNARDLQFIQFHSEDWAGDWWSSFSYEQLKGWRLA